MPLKGQIETSIVRREKALELRMAGMSYYYISKELGVSKSTAFSDVQKALKEIQSRYTEVAENIRTIELARIERLILGIWHSARKGDLQAIDRINRLMERKSRLLGLDAPTKQEVKSEDTVYIIKDIDIS